MSTALFQAIEAGLKAKGEVETLNNEKGMALMDWLSTHPEAGPEVFVNHFGTSSSCAVCENEKASGGVRVDLGACAVLSSRMVLAYGVELAYGVG
eukprot:1955380-Rhodomonas_salina.1